MLISWKDLCEIVLRHEVVTCVALSSIVSAAFGCEDQISQTEAK